MRGFFAAIIFGSFLSGLPGTAAWADADRQSIDGMPPSEISALQRRLADDMCYAGPIDGQPTATTKAAVAACPDQRPLLRIETGMHTSAIRRIAVDAGCKLAATASEDKTVRLWSLPKGTLLRTLRLPIGEGEGGKVNATAVSPDGRFVAAGGWDAADAVSGAKNFITVFDVATGAVMSRVGPFDNRIEHLVFSRDGRWLATTLNHGAGLRVVDTTTWLEIARDRNYGDASYGAAFAPDGQLYTTSFDGKLRRYGPGPKFAKEAEVATLDGKQPYSLAVNPSGTRIAVGFFDSTAVTFYDAPLMRQRKPSDTAGIGYGNLSSVAWGRDGRMLIAGGRYRKGGEYSILLSTRDGRRLGEAPLAKNTIMHLKVCGDGFAVAAADPAFGLLDASGSKRLWRAGVMADMRDKLGDAFTVSADAKRVRFGLGIGSATPVTFDLISATLIDSPEAPSDLIRPKLDGLSVTNWQNTAQLGFAGQAIPLKPHESSHSLAIHPGNDGFVLGAGFSLRAFDAGGQQRWKAPVLGDAWGVNLSDDGRIVVAAYDDGTIRWHRWSDGRELLALFVNKDTRAWVAWTTSGYYMASPGGEDMIGWHVNRGWTQAADFFPAAEFRDQFSRPDVVEKILDTLDEAEAVKQANASRGGKVAPTTPVLEQLPPVISIISPIDGAAAEDKVRLDYLVRSPSGLPLEAVEALLDGRPASAERGLGRIDESNELKQCLGQTRGLGRTEGGGLEGCRGSLTVSLPPGVREVGLFARAGNQTSEVARMRLKRTTPAGGPGASRSDLMKPKLYALVVGISAYSNPDYLLTYPAKDARDFAAALTNQKGGLYADVEIKTLADEQATAGEIREGLDWLTKQVTSRDVGVVYLAGHGALDEHDRFYFLASDSDGRRLRSTAVPREDIADALDALPGKALLFLDACHSGAVAGSRGRRGTVDVNSVVNEFARSERGVVVFAASTGRQVSQENAAWNNGAFTKAVVEGLGLPGTKSKADLVGAGTITTSELDAYVANRVKALTGGSQSPVMIRPATVPDFPLALAR